MATNSILPFGATASNELSDAAYSADAQRLTGNQPGVARSQLVNKAMHQMSLMSAALAQYIADRQGTNVVDSLTPAQVAALLATAASGRLINIRAITASGTFTPTAGTQAVLALVQGAGGGGAGSGVTAAGTVSVGGGGNSGGWGASYLTTGFSGVSLTIGAAGTAGAASGNGGTGGTTTGFGISAPGGEPGTTVTSAGPNITAGPTNSAITSGGNLWNGSTGCGVPAVINNTSSAISGSGGDSFFGHGPRGLVTTGGGQTANNKGCGGAGGLSPVSAGGNVGGAGAPGFILVLEFGG